MYRSALAVVLAGAALGCSSATPTKISALPRWDRAGFDAAPLEPRARTALAFAYAQVGKRYCWGGTGPSCFDCSGLVQAAWRAAGVRIPRTSAEQGRALTQVRFEEMQPGDILWWPHHVGLYAGNGEMIDAYHSRAGVVRRRLAVPRKILRVTR